MTYHRDRDQATRGVGAVDAVDRFKSPARRAREFAARRASAARDLARGRRGMQGSLGRMKEEGAPDDEAGGGSGAGGRVIGHPLRTPPKPGQIISPAAKHPGVRAPVTSSATPPKIMVLPKTPVIALPGAGLRAQPIRDAGFTTSAPPQVLTYPAPLPVTVTGVRTVSSSGSAWVAPVAPIPPPISYDDGGGDLEPPEEAAPAAPPSFQFSKPMMIGAAALALYLLFGRKRGA